MESEPENHLFKQETAIFEQFWISFYQEMTQIVIDEHTLQVNRNLKKPEKLQKTMSNKVKKTIWYGLKPP